MRFAWYGFSLEHPDDWGPASISGDRASGYARLGDALGNGVQVRWATYKTQPFPTERVESYLSKLKKDHEKKRVAFRSHVEPGDERIRYSYQGSLWGVGELRISPSTKRVFFVEACSPESDRQSKRNRPVIDSFESDFESLEPWAVLGLSVRAPAGLVVRQRGFFSGRTKLNLDGPGAKVLLERWGFAEQLVARHGLESWAREALAMKTAEAVVRPDQLALRLPGAFFQPDTEALVQVDAATNQIQLVRVTTRKDEWRPTWDWLTK